MVQLSGRASFYVLYKSYISIPLIDWPSSSGISCRGHNIDINLAEIAVYLLEIVSINMSKRGRYVYKIQNYINQVSRILIYSYN